MSAIGDGPSPEESELDLDNFFTNLPEFTAADWEAVIGEPPDWYYSLVGQVAVASGNLERQAVEVGLVLHQQTWTATDAMFWLSKSSRMETLFDLVKGRDSDFDDLVVRLRLARGKRNAIVHVAVVWNDWDSPEEPSGWHVISPRTRGLTYLTEGVREDMKRDLGLLVGIRNDLWDLWMHREGLS